MVAGSSKSDSSSFRRLNTRGRLPGHGSSFVTAPEAQDLRAYSTLAKLVFGPMPAVVGESRPDEDEKKRLARLFYALPTFRHPEIRYGSDPDLGPRVTPNEFLSQVSTCQDRDTPISYLVGPRGTGKTTLINYLITTTLPSFTTRSEAPLWFVRLNIEYIRRQHSKFLLEHVYGGLAEKMLQVLGDNYLAEVPHLATAMANLRLSVHDGALSSADPLIRVADAMRFDPKRPRRLFLILDNWDGLFHDSDSLTFSEDPPTNHAPYWLLYKFALQCARSGTFARHGITTLIVTRDDSFQMLSLLQSTSGGASLALDEQTFSFRPIQAAEAFEARIELFRERLASPPPIALLSTNLSDSSSTPPGPLPAGSERKFRDALAAIGSDELRTPLKGFGDGGQSFHEIILTLVNNSLRRSIDFFSTYSWLRHPFDPSAPLERLAAHPHLGVLTLILEGKRRFTQDHCHFPALFVVRPPAGQTRTGGTLSWWLKWLVLQTVTQQGSIALRDLQKDLAGGPSHTYRPELFSQSMKDLVMAPRAAPIFALKRLDSDHHALEIASLLSTPSGLFLAKHLAFRFVYLQLIVDDEELTLPSYVIDQFKQWEKQVGRVDYGYILESDTSKYLERARDMVHLRAKQVFALTGVLRAALADEQEKYRNAFQAAASRGVEFPDFDGIEQQLHGEIELISRHLKRGLSPNDYVPDSQTTMIIRDCVNHSLRQSD